MPLDVSVKWESSRARAQGGDPDPMWGVPGRWGEAGLPSRSAFEGWALKNGGGPDGDTVIRLNLQASKGRTVTIDDLRVKMISRSPSPVATLFDLCSRCGQVLTTDFAINLDRETPTVEASSLSEKGEKIDLPRKVSQEDVEAFDVHASTQKCDCRWTLLLDWTSSEKSGTIEVKNRNEPFRTVNFSGKTEFCNYYGQDEKIILR